MTDRLSLPELESYLWGAATILRGLVDAGDYKQFIFPLLFYKRICDVYDEECQRALDESGGHICAVSDDEILQAYRLVARCEGVFCEPSSAAGLAGIARGLREGWFQARGKRVVCVLTGHGLKDPDTAIKGCAAPVTIEPRIDNLLALLT